MSCSLAALTPTINSLMLISETFGFQSASHCSASADEPDNSGPDLVPVTFWVWNHEPNPNPKPMCSVCLVAGLSRVWGRLRLHTCRCIADQFTQVKPANTTHTQLKCQHASCYHLLCPFILHISTITELFNAYSCPYVRGAPEKPLITTL